MLPLVVDVPWILLQAHISYEVSSSVLGDKIILLQK